MLGNIGAGELTIIATLILVFFGKNKLNDLARGLGESSKEFKKVTQDYKEAVSGDYSTKTKKQSDSSEGGDS